MMQNSIQTMFTNCLFQTSNPLKSRLLIDEPQRKKFLFNIYPAHMQM